MQSLETKTSSKPVPYSLADWQRGYESQPQEFETWIDDIEGEIPGNLTGTLFRNGPGLLDVAGEPIGHPFDGDGMICQITFQNGRAHFRNRFVRTEGYLAEQAAGKILYRGVFGTQKAGGWLANLLDLKIKNIANTHVMYWADRLWALWEAAEPHRLDPETLETIGLDSIDGLLKPGDAFAAHARIDPGTVPGAAETATGANRWAMSPNSAGDRRFVNFAVKPGLSTNITIYELDEAGKLASRQTRSVPGFAFLHDFAITPHWCIFFQNPVKFNPLPFMLGFKGAGQCLEFDPKQPTRALLIPRDPSQAVRVLDVPPCFVFHHGNAFESPDGQQITIDSVCYDSFPTLEPGADFRSVDFGSLPEGQLWRFEMDLTTDRVRSHCIESRCCEFPSLHPNAVGHEHRYLYIGAARSPQGNAPLQAVLKLDLQTGDRALFDLGARVFGGEPLFVPNPQATQEDDGWVLLLAYNAERHASDLIILAAQDLSLVARLKLKHHVPYGLHGSFVPQVFGIAD